MRSDFLGIKRKPRKITFMALAFQWEYVYNLTSTVE